MARSLVSVSIITRDRTDELEGVLRSIAEQDYPELEIVIGDNGSQNENLAIIRALAAKTPRTRLFEFSENLGVSGGRSAVLVKCRGAYVVEIDDDALFAHNEVISHAVNRLAAEPDIGILAFKVVNHHTQQIDRQEFPFLTKRRDPELPGDTSWFIGCGHCFRRALLDRIGAYRDFFPYAAEELDYSFRALDSGFRIVYDPRLMVWHKRSLKHRITDPIQWGALCLKQRLKVAALNLPWPFWFSYLLVRGFLYSGRLRHPTVISRALSMLQREWPYIRSTRQVIRWRTVARILRLRGPIFF